MLKKFPKMIRTRHRNNNDMWCATRPCLCSVLEYFNGLGYGGLLIMHAEAEAPESLTQAKHVL